ncbi:23S rRNA (uracil-5-)-methyltransferase rumA [Edwardsiella piscicida]|nr:23S rRNA (uracil-5-)-methyltransferase rumA [Edwardsiella piscicida]
MLQARYAALEKVEIGRQSLIRLGAHHRGEIEQHLTADTLRGLNISVTEFDAISAAVLADIVTRHDIDRLLSDGKINGRRLYANAAIIDDRIIIIKMCCPIRPSIEGRLPQFNGQLDGLPMLITGQRNAE